MPRRGKDEGTFGALRRVVLFEPLIPTALDR